MDDELLGKELKSLPLKDNKIVVNVVVLAVAVVITAIIWKVQPIAGFFMAIADIILLILGIIGGSFDLFWKIRVGIHEHGMRVMQGRRRETILWQDIVGIQTNRDSALIVTEPAFIPFIIPLPFVIAFGFMRRRGGAYWSHFSHYVLHLRDKKPRELTGGAELFELMPVLEEKVVERLTSETVKRFESGERICLTDSITYSQDGLKGTLVRQTRHSRREVQVNLPWDQIDHIYFLEQNMRFRAYDNSVTNLLVGDIVNLPAFLAVLDILHEEKGIPKVDRQR